LGLAIKGNRSRLSPSTTGTSIEEQIKKLREGDGGDIITFGSPVFVQSLTNAELVDEYRILIHLVIVNEGKRLFEHLDGRTDFRLISIDTLERGANALSGK
jgi:dihydrofolate reductase